MVISDLLILGLLIGAAVAAVVAVSSSRTPRCTHSEWVAEHTTVGDQTVVVVARKLSNPDRFDMETAERREIGAITNDDAAIALHSAALSQSPITGIAPIRSRSARCP
jgi:hypothetical protein